MGAKRKPRNSYLNIQRCKGSHGGSLVITLIVPVIKLPF